MRTSCNGCRVLRKGCSEDCTIRPCLQWIKSPESQANATVFLAKFYGRAGLLNLLNAGPEHLRPAVLKSLLYEACGRVVDPVNGSVGLMWSGQWHCCQIAVDAVLKGLPIMQMPQQSQVRYDNRDRQIPSSDPSSSAADPLPVVGPKLPQDDIRHVSSSCRPTGAAGFVPARIGHRTGNRSSSNYGGGFYSYMQGETVGGRNRREEETGGREDSQEDRESMFSVETVEPTMTDIEKMGELGVVGGRSQLGESDDSIGLELTLGFNHHQGFPGSSSTMTNGYRGRRREY